MSALAVFDSVSLLCLVTAMTMQLWNPVGRNKEIVQRWLLNFTVWGWLAFVTWMLIFRPRELESEFRELWRSFSGI